MLWDDVMCDLCVCDRKSSNLPDEERERERERGRERNPFSFLLVNGLSKFPYDLFTS